MVDEPILPPKYSIAEGPSGLKKELESLLERSHQEPEFANQVHYILYQLGSQKSLIRVDLSKKPFQFWYYDLLGRPATKAVKDIIIEFLWEKGGEKELHLEEIGE